jgi:hypothetical protein
MKLENLLIENNFIDKYKPDDLGNEIANIDNGNQIYSLSSFNFIDQNLLEWLLKKFGVCNDLKCLQAYEVSIKSNMKFIMDKKRVRGAKVAQDLFMLRQSISISTLILINMNNIEIADLTHIIEENRKMLAE